MASSWGSFDFSALKTMQKQFEKAVDERVVERFIQDFLAEMAFRALRKIKRRTPVDSGDLRRNWQVGKVERQGDSYVVELFNNTEYGQFVEFGHRSGPGLTEWTEGRFMMTISMQEIERELPSYLEKRMAELLHNIVNGRPIKKG